MLCRKRKIQIDQSKNWMSHTNDLFRWVYRIIDLGIQNLLEQYLAS